MHYFHVRSLHRGNYYSVDRLTSILHETEEVVKKYPPVDGIIQLVQLKEQIQINQSRRNVQDKYILMYLAIYCVNPFSRDVYENDICNDEISLHDDEYISIPYSIPNYN